MAQGTWPRGSTWQGLSFLILKWDPASGQAQNPRGNDSLSSSLGFYWARDVPGFIQQMSYWAIRLLSARAEHQVFSTGFLRGDFYRGHKTGMFLTDYSRGKARYRPLSQPFVNASGILFWVTMFSKKKRKEKFLRKWTSFFHRKRMFIVDQSTGLGRYNIQPSPSLPPPNNQALVENCTTRCIIKPAHVCKEYCKHRYVCFQAL